MSLERRIEKAEERLGPSPGATTDIRFESGSVWRLTARQVNGLLRWLRERAEDRHDEI